MWRLKRPPVGMVWKVGEGSIRHSTMDCHGWLGCSPVAAVAEWYRYRTVACFVTGSSPVPLKTRRVGQRCTLHLSRAETSSRWWVW
ncbi:uncharacterized protein TNCV_4789331 [Trichonephila clavipes]|nr:uncharacterized protein TNCV_4789331 [Trichonephila clavipes]